jgi:ribonuclease P protein component
MGAPARLGIVASRKVGNAVVRNRAKRLVREAFRSSPDLFSPGTDVVVIVRRPLEKSKLGDVVSEWRRAAGVLDKRSAEARSDRDQRRDEAEQAE